MCDLMSYIIYQINVYNIWSKFLSFFLGYILLQSFERFLSLLRLCNKLTDVLPLCLCRYKMILLMISNLSTIKRAIILYRESIFRHSSYTGQYYHMTQISYQNFESNQRSLYLLLMLYHYSIIQ